MESWTAALLAEEIAAEMRPVAERISDDFVFLLEVNQAGGENLAAIFELLDAAARAGVSVPGSVLDRIEHDLAPVLHASVSHRIRRRVAAARVAPGALVGVLAQCARIVEEIAMLLDAAGFGSEAVELRELGDYAGEEDSACAQGVEFLVGRGMRATPALLAQLRRFVKDTGDDEFSVVLAEMEAIRPDGEQRS